MFLGEKCYFVNQSSIVARKVKELKENIKNQAQELEDWDFGFNPQMWLRWILPVLGPCILRTLAQHLKATVTRRAAAKVLALQRYQHRYQQLQPSSVPQPYSQAYGNAKGIKHLRASKEGTVTGLN